MINFRLEVFYTTAKEKSFTKAAELLSISQPAVTKHIKALEEHYKTPLFNRIANNIELTKAGELLFVYASKIINTYSELNNELSLLSVKTKYLKIGITSEISEFLVAKLLSNSKYLPWKINIQLFTQDELLIKLQNGELDFGIIFNECEIDNIESYQLLKTEIALVSSQKVSESDLHNLKFVANNIDSQINKINDLQDITVCQLNNYLSIIELVKKSALLSYIPTIFIQNELLLGELYEISGKSIPLNIQLVFLKEKSTMHKNFIDYFVKIASLP